ncbi:unnamed protein product [Euphydryas editha]|uniref:Uncharacterized protein n=1 Tax=Euphydryas editha TaxID=104508 RepID=A0AAU9ULE6_EUPED|nr:unnamed protein product [Euphydryas editha]
MILIAMLLIIVMFLCSTKYWRDVHNYINANITITHIPKRSEVSNWTIIDDTTEYYEVTTNMYESTLTTDGVNKDYFDLDDVKNRKKKRSVKIVETKDYSEVSEKNKMVDYYFNIDEPKTEDMNDLVDESKLTTRDMKDVEMVPGILLNTQGYLENVSNTCDIFSSAFSKLIG